MGAAFDKWLAKPSTIHFLRGLVAPHDGQTPLLSLANVRRSHVSQRSLSHESSHRASRCTSDEPTNRSDGFATRPRHLHILSPAELGLQMSLNAGVPLLGQEGHADQAFSELRFQSDVNSDAKEGKLLVDNAAHRTNISLWVEILRFRQRVNGLEGVLAVWNGMRRRNVDLPTNGDGADTLWSTFIHSGINPAEGNDGEAGQLLSEVLKYAQDLKARSGMQYDGLYKSIVGRCFRVKPKGARKWHHYLCTSTGLANPEAMSSVAIDAILSTNRQQAFRIFTQMYRSSNVRNLYDSCINEAINLDDEIAALRWHRLFIQNGDAPTNEFFNTPAVQRLFDLDGDSSLPMKGSPEERDTELRTHKRNSTSKFPAFTRQSMNAIVGDVYGIKPKEISDNFCARLFATRAFSVDLVLKGLPFLGIDSLGPLAIREMAIRSRSTVEFGNRVASLKDHGLKFGDSTFARLVVKLANEGQSVLWTTLLESDQHPEVYEDAATQETLLISFLEQGKWKQAHVALTALSFTDPQAQLRGWNRVLQHQMIRKDYRPMLSTVQSMQNQGIPLTLYSVALMRQHVLQERRRTKRPVSQHDPRFFDPLGVVTNACIHTAEKGHFVPVNMWKELLKRYGMANRWGATERLAIWLFDHYSSKSVLTSRQLDLNDIASETPAMRQLRILRMVFSSVTLRALFTWGFRSQSRRLSLSPSADKDRGKRQEPWAQGLALLKRLHNRNLLDITGDARKAFQQRMWTLFGVGYSTLGTNNEARRVNQISLAHYIVHANEVWDGLIDWVDPSLLTRERQHDPQLLVEFFGAQYTTNRKTSEYADVQAWADSLGTLKSDHYFQSASVHQNKRQWERSSLRIIRPREDAGGSTSTAFAASPQLFGAGHQYSTKPAKGRQN